MADPFERLARAVFARSADVAHDLKTPLNIVVLNVELLKMRLQKLAPEAVADEKISEHFRALERESRRLAALADAFLRIASEPTDAPERVDLVRSLTDSLRESGFETDLAAGCTIEVHPSRVATLTRLFSSALKDLLEPSETAFEMEVERGRLTMVVEGRPRHGSIEGGKLLKFYYTDPSGEPNPSLAAARLLLETMGGSLVVATATENKVRFEIEAQGEE